MTDRAGWWRAALVLTCLSVAAATTGTTVRLPTRHAAGSTSGVGGHQPWPWLVGWTLVVGAALVVRRIVVRVRRNRNRDPEVVVQELPAVGRGFVTVVLLCFLVVPWLLLWALRSGLGDQLRGHHLHDTSPVATTGHQGAGVVHGSPSSLATIAVLVAALLVLAALVAIRARHGGDLTETPAGALPDEDGADDQRVAEAFGRARRAGRLGTTPRERVILAYDALEHELAGAGLAHLPSETPDELLRRVAADRPALTAPCAELTATFQAARFSTRPLSAADAESAETALSRLESALGSGLESALRSATGVGNHG